MLIWRFSVGFERRQYRDPDKRGALDCRDAVERHPDNRWPVLALMEWTIYQTAGRPSSPAATRPPSAVHRETLAASAAAASTSHSLLLRKSQRTVIVP